MKKFIKITFLQLLFCSFAHANCMIDTEINVKRFSPEAQFEILNNNDKAILVTEIKLLTSKNQIIKSFKISGGNLKPFGRIEYWLNINDVNKKVWKNTSLSCQY